MKDLISVIIPVYNVELYLAQCLDSIINQTYSNLEIIVINDGSTDNSIEIVKHFNKNDQRIKVIDRGNKGVLFSRIEGLNIATGKYVIFLDSDDYLKENTIEIMHNEIIDKNVDLVKCNKCNLINGREGLSKTRIKENTLIEDIKNNSLFYDLLYKTIFLNSMCGALIKKDKLSSIRDIDYSLVYGEDLVWCLKMYDQINSIYVLEESFYVYRINNMSITNSKNIDKIKRKMEDIIKVYYSLFRYAENTNDPLHYQKHTLAKLYYLIADLSLVMLCNTSLNNEDEVFLKNIVNDKRIKEMSNGIDIKDELKNYNIIYRIAIKLLLHDKINRLYYFANMVYKPLKRG